MRIVFAIAGAIFGASLSSLSRELLGVLLGGLAGFVLADLAAQRTRVRALQDELKALRGLIARQPRAAHDADPRQSASPHADVENAKGAVIAAGLSDEAALETGMASASGAAAAGVAPSKSGALDAILRFVREYFTGGNTLVRVGVIILFFGVAFLLRYVAEHSHVPIELRLSGVALCGVVLLLLGWRLRAARPGYAFALQGGAVGILYLTVFAGLRIYSVLPQGAAFVLLVALAAFSAALAILQDSQGFALLAVTGGFLAPVLASTGQGNHVVLFSYYAVLNGAILAIAWFKAWRPLNLAGFLFTFVIGTAWGVLQYRPALFAATEPFLILFFLLYVAIAILFAARRVPELRGYVDGTLVFGAPIVAFGLQSGMLRHRKLDLAVSALAVSAFYFTLAWCLRRGWRESQRLLVEVFMALAVAFLTLAIPLALDGRWTAATWALEGAALVWTGCRQERSLPRACGVLLQIAAGLMLGSEIDSPHGGVPILNSACLGGAMVSASSVFAASSFQRYRERLRPYEATFTAVLFFWGVFWWLYSGLTEIQRRVPDRYDAAASLLFVAASALVSSELTQRTRLILARLPALWLLPAMAFYAALAVVEVHHPFAEGGWLSWPLAFGVFYRLCRRHEGPPDLPPARRLHVGGIWLMTALVTWEVAWAIDEAVAGAGSWPAIAWALVPATVLFSMPRLAARIRWPFGEHREAYLALAGAGFAVYLALWSVVTNVMLPGNPYPIPFVPLLNPLDLAQMLVLMVLLRSWLAVRAGRFQSLAAVRGPSVFAALAALTFIWLNAALLRTLHHWAVIPFRLDAMMKSTLAETSLSIFWAAIALATMLAATRFNARWVWLTGAGLLGIVIVKLFAVDLSRVGTVERIVSFVGVGLLMLVIGYFSPLPPASARGEARGARMAG